jgi:hypothetical protein
MVQTIAADQLMLYDLEQKFSLQRIYDRQFFLEWQGISSALPIVEQERLERTKQHYIHLASRPMLEGMAKLVIVSPLLDLAGFFDPPFYSNSQTGWAGNCSESCLGRVSLATKLQFT